MRDGLQKHSLGWFGPPLRSSATIGAADPRRSWAPGVHAPGGRDPSERFECNNGVMLRASQSRRRRAMRLVLLLAISVCVASIIDFGYNAYQRANLFTFTGQTSSDYRDPELVGKLEWGRLQSVLGARPSNRFHGQILRLASQRCTRYCG